MERKRRYILASVAILIIALFLNINAYGTSFEKPDAGEPPRGEATQGDSAGTQLDGSAFVEFNNLYFDEIVQEWFASTATIYLRLRKAGLVVMMAESALNVNISDKEVTFQQLADVMRDQIVSEFFEEDPEFSDLQVTVKTLGDYGEITLPGPKLYVLTEVVVSVK